MSLRLSLALIFILTTSSLLAQVRVNKLVIKAKETYVLAESDIIVADTLIMMDSSTLVLNNSSAIILYAPNLPLLAIIAPSMVVV